MQMNTQKVFGLLWNSDAEVMQWHFDLAWLDALLSKCKPDYWRICANLFL